MTDAIGLSERLLRGHNNSGIGPLDCKLGLEELEVLNEEKARLTDLANKRWREAVAARKEIDTLRIDNDQFRRIALDRLDKLTKSQARVKELEARLGDLAKPEEQREWLPSATIDKLQARATRAEQERDEALERLKPFASDFDMNDCDDRKDDDALEVSIKDLRAARDCVRRLASIPSDPMKENSHG